jgi:histidine triad (HIT) family protein
VSSLASDSKCLFCKFATGEVPVHAIFEDDYLVAFLDIGPIRTGHVQIIPRMHYEYFDDLPLELATKIIKLAQKIATVQKKLYKVRRVGFLFTGGDIPHAYAHLVPMQKNTDITSRQYLVEKDVTFQAIPNASDSELKAVAENIRSALEAN